jgi:hypothetical protein
MSIGGAPSAWAISKPTATPRILEKQADAAGTDAGHGRVAY